MELQKIKESCIKQTPSLAQAIDWDNIIKALVINFGSSNFGDIHRSIRHSLGNKKSNKTHIDLTSSPKMAIGENPVFDFFEEIEERHDYEVLLNTENIKSFNVKYTSKEEWQSNKVTFRRLKPRNISGNPSAQLLELNDLLDLRLYLSVGSSLIILKSKQLKYLGLGTTHLDHKSPLFEVDGRVKSKKLFIFNELSQDTSSDQSNDTTITSARRRRTQSASGNRQRYNNNPRYNKAVEDYSMGVVKQIHVLEGWNVNDVSTPELALDNGLSSFPGYDYLMRTPTAIRNIEVKGTASNGVSVIISENELRSALRTENWMLAVVSNILVANENKDYLCTGGNYSLYQLQNRKILANYIKRLDALRDTSGIYPSSFKFQIEIIKVGFSKLDSHTI